MPDVAVMEQALTHITDHPEQHQQGSWTCETGACFAGHVALLNGWHKEIIPWQGYGSPPSWTVRNGIVVNDLGDRRRVEEVACGILGIDSETAKVLFHGANTREDLALMVKDIANGEYLPDLWSLGVAGELGELIAMVRSSQ